MTWRAAASPPLGTHRQGANVGRDEASRSFERAAREVAVLTAQRAASACTTAASDAGGAGEEKGHRFASAKREYEHEQRWMEVHDHLQNYSVVVDAMTKTMVFSEGTGIGVDQWHPRWLLLLSEPALWALATLLNAIEEFGK